MGIVDNYGAFIGHPDKKLLGKDLVKTMNNDADYMELLKSSKSNQEYAFIKKSLLKDGLESAYYSVPFSIQETGTNWSFIISAPVSEYLENAIFIRNFSILASIVGLIIIGISIY